jgi:hypothetical protein
MKYANLGLWKVKFFTTIFVLFTACSVYAFGLGDIGSMLGGGGPDLSGKQTELTGSLRSALINLGKSQVIMAKALGLDEQVMLAEQNVKNMEAGDMGTSDEVEKSIEISASVQEEIAKETAKKTVLDGAGKAVFVTSIPFYIKGVLGSVQTGKDAAQIGQSMASLNPAALLQVGTLVKIVSNMPDLITKLSSSTGQIMDFMTANEIDNSEMSDKLANAF